MKECLKMEGKSSSEYIPGISFSLKWGKIRIYRSNLYRMGNPGYIRMLFDPKKKRFALQACGKIKGSIRVPDRTGEDWDFRVNSIGLLRMIWNITGWDDDYSYQIIGQYYTEQKLVEFDLTKAVKIDIS